MILFFFISASFLITWFLYRRDCKYMTSKYKDVASDEMRRALNLKTGDNIFEKEILSRTKKNQLSREILEEMSRSERKGGIDD